MRVRLASLLLTMLLAGCGLGDPSENPTTTRTSAVTLSLGPTADTFINSVDPDNNNGASQSFFTGENGQGGVMRGLLQFALPAGLQGRVTVSGVTLTLTTEAVGTGTMLPAAATESLQRVNVAWTEGTGAGNAMMTYTVGQPCGTTGATWNDPDCTGGTPWAGGDVTATVSGTASAPAELDTAVIWDSMAGSAGLLADVQAWMDDPATNHGWMISSSTEGTSAKAQRFYSREVAGKGPALGITFACTAEFADAGPTCGITLPADGGGADAAGGAAGSGAPSTGGGCSCSLGTSGVSPGALGLLGVALLGRRRRRQLPLKARPRSPLTTR